ncbi:MAG: RNB domain-containing ribonuclease, partial [Burkholderiales bacterium]|nr:RNB domain-containing ribonuclease [Burkholderiales bacterium]
MRVHGASVAQALLSELQAAGVPLQPRDLARRTGFGSPAHAAFQQALLELEREGSVMQNRRGALCLVDNLDLIRGRVHGHADGYGFLVRDDGKPDCFVGTRQMHKALHGDRVMAREIGLDRRGRCEVAIVEVLERANVTVVGRLRRDYGILVVEPEDRRINQPLLVAPDGAGEALPGQVVVAQIVAQPSRAVQPVAKIVEVLGSYTDPGMEIEIALRKHRLPYRFGAQAQAEAARFAPMPQARDMRGRKDLRAAALVTIDGENARDFDDAVWCEALTDNTKAGGRAATSGGFRLVVAIADVSHYVHHGAALDREALERG